LKEIQSVVNNPSTYKVTTFGFWILPVLITKLVVFLVIWYVSAIVPVFFTTIHKNRTKRCRKSN
jgi:hypothetical protein